MNKKRLTILITLITTLSTLLLTAIILVTIYFVKFYPPVKVGGNIGFVSGTYAVYDTGNPDFDSFTVRIEEERENCVVEIASGDQTKAFNLILYGTAGNKEESMWGMGFFIDDVEYCISCDVIGKDRNSITGLETTVTKQVFYGEPDEYNIQPSTVTTIYSFTLDKIA